MKTLPLSILQFNTFVKNIFDAEEFLLETTMGSLGIKGRELEKYELDELRKIISAETGFSEIEEDVIEDSNSSSSSFLGDLLASIFKVIIRVATSTIDCIKNIPEKLSGN